MPTARPRYVELQDEINALPGMADVKETVNRIVDQAMMNKIFAEHGLPPEPTTNHMVITGNPGTGKTRTTRKLGALFHELGLSSSPEVVQLTRAQLVGPHANTAAATTKRLIDENRGKVIFIDEAYTLYQGPQDREGRQSLDELMRLAEEYRNDTVFVLAGYADQLDEMFEVNPGLRSRFPRSIDLPDYTASEKAQVLEYIVAENKRSFDSPRAAKRARAYAARLESGGDKGNARAVRNFYDLMRDAQSSRIVSQYAQTGSVDSQALKIFTADDVTWAAAMAGLPPLVTRQRAKPTPAAAASRSGYRARVKPKVPAEV